VNCRRVSNLLSAYIDGELTGEEQLKIQEHLRQCDECAEEHESLLMTKRLICSLKMKEPREELEARILNAVAQEVAPSRRRFPWGVWWAFLSHSERRRLQLAAAFCAASLAAFAYMAYSTSVALREESIASRLPPRPVSVSPSNVPVNDYLFVHDPWDRAQPSRSRASIVPAGQNHIVQDAR
jgi:anti-sigma factor RsiW